MPASSSNNIGLEGRNDYLKKKPERVKVFVRLRPFLEEEYGSSKVCSIDSFDSKNKVIQSNSLLSFRFHCIISTLSFWLVKKDYDKKVFNFDGIFEPKISQEEVYSAIAAPVIQVNIRFYCYVRFIISFIGAECDGRIQWNDLCIRTNRHGKDIYYGWRELKARNWNYSKKSGRNIFLCWKWLFSRLFNLAKLRADLYGDGMIVFNTLKQDN